MFVACLQTRDKIKSKKHQLMVESFFFQISSLIISEHYDSSVCVLCVDCTRRSRFELEKHSEGRANIVAIYPDIFKLYSRHYHSRTYLYRNMNNLIIILDKMYNKLILPLAVFLSKRFEIPSLKIYKNYFLLFQKIADC